MVDWDMFAITAWSLWKNRNTIRHEGRGKTVAEMVRMAAEYAKEVKQSHQVQIHSSTPGKPSWSPQTRVGIKLIQMGLFLETLDVAVWEL